MHGFYGGFEYAARGAREELIEEARRWRLARLAPRRGFRERVGRLLEGLRGAVPRRVTGAEVAVGGEPSAVYLARGEEGGLDQAVEVYVGGGGRVERRTDLRTGMSTDSFLVDARVRR